MTDRSQEHYDRYYSTSTTSRHPIQHPHFSEEVNEFLNWAKPKAAAVVGSLVRHACRAGGHSYENPRFVTMETLERIADGDLHVRQVGEARVARLRYLLQEFYTLDLRNHDTVDPRITRIFYMARHLTPSSLDLLLALVRDLYEHGALREEGDRAADVGREP